jgi:hypothetical protein
VATNNGGGTGQYPWYQGGNAQGWHVEGGPRGIIVPGQVQRQNGGWSFPPSVTAPGTVASAGTVANSTGYDCYVYVSATTGIQAVKIFAYNGANAGSILPAGTVPGAATATYFVPGPGAIAVTYTGTLTWAWQAA